MDVVPVGVEVLRIRISRSLILFDRLKNALFTRATDFSIHICTIETETVICLSGDPFEQCKRVFQKCPLYSKFMDLEELNVRQIGGDFDCSLTLSTADMVIALGMCASRTPLERLAIRRSLNNSVWPSSAVSCWTLIGSD